MTAAQEALQCLLPAAECSSLVADFPALLASSPAAVALVVTHFASNYGALHAHLAAHGGLLCTQAVFARSEQRWELYCADVERRQRGMDADDAAALRHQAAVFGTCRRCGSARLLVTTQQLRRADEGSTEIRLCRDCGHVSRINS